MHVNSYNVDRFCYYFIISNYCVLGQIFNKLCSRVSRSLDQNLNNDVARQLLEDQPINTKTDLVLEAAQEGAVALLRKWPNMRSKLHVCFNQPLTGELRQLAWKLFLENSKCM